LLLKGYPRPYITPGSRALLSDALFRERLDDLIGLFKEADRPIHAPERRDPRILWM
jgi:hypothetical protein